MSQHMFDQNTANTVSTKKGTSPRLQNNDYQKTKSHNTIIDNLGLSENRAPQNPLISHHVPHLDSHWRYPMTHTHPPLKKAMELLN